MKFAFSNSNGSFSLKLCVFLQLLNNVNYHQKNQNYK